MRSNPLARLAVVVLALSGCSQSSGNLCGTGTHAEGSTCVSDGALSCGPGTHLDGSGTCLPDGGLSCGPGTHLEGTQCVPDATAIVCGAGTHLLDGACVPDSTLTCGPGTHADAGQCLPDVATLSCGPGTHAEGLLCLPDAAITCGPGTHLDGSGTCLPDGSTVAYYDLRVPVAEIPADGYTKIPVLAIGRLADGTPAADEVVVYSDRPWAGIFSPASFSLAPLGSTVWFTPCSTASAACVGPIRFTLAPASDPTVVLAQTPVLQIVAPSGVGSPAPCLVGGNALYFDGDNWVFTGTQTVRDGVWTATSSPAEPTYVNIGVTPSDPAQGLWWDATFSTQQIGLPLAVQVYQGAMRWPFESPGHPGLDVTGDGRGCNEISGQFELQELVLSAGAIQRFTATFEEWCDWTGVLRGCVHYEQ